MNKSKMSPGSLRTLSKKDAKKCISRVPSPRPFPSIASATFPSSASRAGPLQDAYASGPDEPPMTVAVVGRRKEIARRIGDKIKPPQVYDAKQLPQFY